MAQDARGVGLEIPERSRVCGRLINPLLRVFIADSLRAFVGRSLRAELSGRTLLTEETGGAAALKRGNGETTTSSNGTADPCYSEDDQRRGRNKTTDESTKSRNLQLRRRDWLSAVLPYLGWSAVPGCCSSHVRTRIYSCDFRDFNTQ